MPEIEMEREEEVWVRRQRRHSDDSMAVICTHPHRELLSSVESKA